MDWSTLADRLRMHLGHSQHQMRRTSALPDLEAAPRPEAVRGLSWSAPLAALAILLLVGIAEDEHYAPALKLLGQLGAAALVPLLVHGTQLVTGVRFWDLTDRWDGLAGWQRGVYGVMVVLAASALLLPAAFWVARHLGE